MPPRSSGLVLAFRLAARYGGWLAGAIAVGGLVLARGWLRLTLDGHLEPLLLTFVLGGAELHLHGRRLAALILFALVGLVPSQLVGK